MMLKNAIHIGDALTTLQKCPSESVNCIMTSPPYYNLRNYGVAGQLGLEQSPDEYLDKLVAIFREARRVLRHDGTCWINMGDSYCGGGGYSPNSPSNLAGSLSSRAGKTGAKPKGVPIPHGYKPKDLMLIPFRLALALQSDGWWVRQTNIWQKPSCMPSSVTDRTTTDFEYVFHLAKASRYWYDADAIREPLSAPLHALQNRAEYKEVQRNDFGTDRMTVTWGNPAGRNKRAVWTIPSEPFPDSHFATFPQALPELCIAAGCPQTCCAECGAGYVRVTEPIGEIYDSRHISKKTANAPGAVVSTSSAFRTGKTTLKQSLGFKPSCDCNTDETMPGVVLDMFFGAGTVGLAAKHLGRDYVGIELNPAYVEMAQQRLKNYDPYQDKQYEDGSKQLSLFSSDNP